MTILKANHLIILLSLLSVTHVADAKQRCTDSKDEQNIAICSELANHGDAQAQNTLGQIYYQDALQYKGYHTKARILFEQAAAQGLAEAQYNLGAMYRDELNNFPVALSWFEKAAAQGNLDAQNSIGYIYENGYGGEPPRLYLFDENGKNINPDVATYQTDYAEYEQQYLPLSDYPRSLYPLSEFGQGVEQNYLLAAEWYQKAAEQGHALAQTNLAYLYLMGLGVKKDEQKAFALYQQAAAQDFVPALNTLGFLYVQGIGTEVDVKAGFACLVKSYQLQPTHAIKLTIFRLQRKKEYQALQLTADLPKVPDRVYRTRFKVDDSSDEDYLTSQLNFLPYFYNLQLIDSEAGAIGVFFVYDRPTKDVFSDTYLGEQDELRKALYLKTALQSDLDYMLWMSWAYEDIPYENGVRKLRQWEKYADKMGKPLAYYE